MDGAGHLQLYRSVALPLFKPVIAVVSIVNILGTWNDFLWPFITNSGTNYHVISSDLYLIHQGPDIIQLRHHVRRLGPGQHHLPDPIGIRHQTPPCNASRVGLSKLNVVYCNASSQVHLVLLSVRFKPHSFLSRLDLLDKAALATLTSRAGTRQTAIQLRADV